MKKKKVINGLLFLSLVIFIGIFSYSLFNIIVWYKDSKRIEEINDELISNVKVVEVKDDENVTVIENDKVNNNDKSNPYWDYIKMDLIDVDFSLLKKTNSDTVGWIKVNGTNINYPFVQTKDNDFYLNHAFDKSYNKAGWVFLDYRNNIENLDKNTILYAHARLDKTMFGTLKEILKNDWYKNKNNHIIKISTEKENSLWQVFSVYHIPTTTDYIKVNFSDDEEFEKFIDKIKKRSVFKFDTEIASSDKIITLSTCYGKTERMVMHAKLIKYSKK